MTVKVENVQTGRVNINLSLLIQSIVVYPLLLDRPGISIVNNVDKSFRAADFSKIDGYLKFDIRIGVAL
jgi:hypothetical protein